MEPFDNDPAGLAYQMFMMSGNPGYYMLYTNILKPEQENEKQRAKERE